MTYTHILSPLRFLVLWLLTSFAISTAYAGKFEDGMVAFKAREYQTALKLWSPLAEQGNVAAQINVGDMYAKGLGVTQDVDRALSLYNKAVTQGSTDAEYKLGELYTRGRGIPRDYEQAIKWHRKAAERGHVEAQYSLGVRYFEGEGVPTDYVTAYAWMDVAAKQGHEPSSLARDRIALALDLDELEKAKAMATKLLKSYTTYK